jgi:DNA invertase Pin-like site-specific DNA recombinase
MTTTPARKARTAASDRPLRVVGYARLSKAHDSSTSIERQRKTIRALYKARGWTLVEIVEDEGVSATARGLDRPGLDRVRAMVAGGQVDAIVFWRLDRLARSVRDASNIAHEMREARVALVSCTEPFDTSTPSGQLMFDLLAAFAAFEAASIRERVLGSQAHLRGLGRWPGGRVPFGYRAAPHPSGAGRCLVPDPAEAEAIRWVTDHLLRGGSLRDAMRHLNAQGFERRFTAHNLRLLAVSGAWTGRVESDGQVERDAEGAIVRYGPPVVSDSEQARLIERLRRPASKGGDGPVGVKTSRSTLLSGLLRCASCGSGMTASGAADRRQYRCENDKGACPRAVTVTQVQADEAVAVEFLARVGNERVVDVWTEDGLPERLPVVEGEIAALTAEIARALAEDRDDEIPALLARQKVLKAERDDLRAQPVEPTVVMRDTGRTYAQAWAAADDDTEARRGLLDRVFASIAVAPGVRGGPRRWMPVEDRLAYEVRELVPTAA